MQSLEYEINILKKKQKEFAKEVDKINGDETKDEKVSPLMQVLYDQIVEANIEILQDTAVIAKFKDIASKFGEDTSKSLVELFATTMTLSSFRAIMFYDEHLTKELDESFKAVENNINLNRADIKAHTGAIDIFRKRLEEINHKIVSSDISKKIDK